MSSTVMPAESARAMEELAVAVSSVDDATLDAIVEERLAARRIACYGGGREGLVMRGLVMRLFHAGLDAHYVGEMTCPHAGVGDLVILSCGNFGNVIRTLMPLVITDDQLERGLAIMEEGLAALSK